MSDEMRAAELAHPGSPPQARTRTDERPDGIMYDTLVVFAPSARWDATLPAADYLEIGLEVEDHEATFTLRSFSSSVRIASPPESYHFSAWSPPTTSW